MKHPQTCEPRRCPRGSGVTQLILLTTSGRVCSHERGQRGQGAWTVPTGAPPALSPHCRGHCSQVLRARGHSRDTIPATGTASLVPGAACQGPPGPPACQVTSIAFVTRPGCLVFCKFQLISLGFPDKTD